MIKDAKESWDRLSDFRRKRNRCRDYTFGRQWNDVIEVNGRPVTEYEYIMSEGNVPLKNNLIRRIVRNVLGVFREKLVDIMAETYPEDMAAIARDNSLEEIFSREMEEFLISGMAVTRKRLGRQDGKWGVWTHQVSPGSFFFNTDSRDVRGWDLNLAGEFHKVSFNEWCKAFAGSLQDIRKAKQYFGDEIRRRTVVEVWKKEIRWESKAREIREVWRYYFLSEEGEILKAGDSPYAHGSHPYVLKCYPYLDGEIQSFVGDMIDQQRYTNRLITLYDWVIRASAKGVLLLPEGAVDPGNIGAVADQWGRFNGVIVYNAKPGNPEPKQVSGNMANIGISELLEIQLKMMEDVSGVNGVLQGKTGGGNVSGELYNSQTTNAMYSLADLMKTFRQFIDDNATKDRMLLRQAQGG